MYCMVDGGSGSDLPARVGTGAGRAHPQRGLRTGARAPIPRRGLSGVVIGADFYFSACV